MEKHIYSYISKIVILLISNNTIYMYMHIEDMNNLKIYSFSEDLFLFI